MSARQHHRVPEGAASENVQATSPDRSPATSPPPHLGARIARRIRALVDAPPLLPAAVRPGAWRLAVLLFAIAVLTLPIALTVRFSAESGWWWERGFENYDVERRTGLARAEVDRAGAELRAYFQSDDTLADITVTSRDGATGPLFSERETLHLVDVKRLLERTYDAGWAAIGFIVAFILGAAYWRRGRVRTSLARAGLYAGVGVVAAIGLLAVVAVTGFDGAFRQFHLLFFTNDLWQLSNRDSLIQMFPQGFFFETTLLIGGVTIAFAAAIALCGRWWLRRPPARAPLADPDPREEGPRRLTTPKKRL